MNKERQKCKNLQVGDLVTHILYGQEWIGMIISFNEDPEASRLLNKEKALVQIQPGTKFDGFFSRISSSDKINDNLGLVSVHWLFKVKEKNENSGPSRDKT